MMDLSPKAEGEDIQSVWSRFPDSLEEAVAHIESKFPLILESTQAYEEFESGNGIIRATHVTHQFYDRHTGGQSGVNVINAWLICMMEGVINSSRHRLYWRMRPQIKCVTKVLPSGPDFVVEIRSRSAMV